MSINIKHFLFSNTGLRQTVIKNVFWLTLAEVIARLFGLVLVVYIARILGVLEYGKFTFALSFASVMSIFSDFGLIDIATREFSRNKENEKKLNTIFTLEFFLCALALVITIISSFFITADSAIREMIWILIVFVLGNNLFGAFFSFLRARQKMEYEAMIKISQGFINVLVVLCIVIYIPSAINVSYGYLFSTLCALALFLFFFRKNFQAIEFAPSKDMFDILKISWPLSFGFMPSWLYISINAILLGYFNLITESGWYGAASRLAIAAMIIANLVAKTFYPALSSLFFSSQEGLKKTWNYFASSMIFLMVPILFGGMALAPKIINTFYGPDFAPSVFAFQILLCIVAIGFINYPYTVMMVISDHQKQNFILMAIGAGINIVLDFIFIPRYGFFGALWATIIASLVVLLCTIFFSKKHRIIIPFNITFVQTAGLSLFSGLVMYVMVSQGAVYHLNVFLDCLLGGAAYFFIYFLLSALFNQHHHFLSYK